jgi:hypothetical protein
MPVSSRDDWLMRMIQQMAQVVARMLGQKNGGQVQEAMQTLDDAQGELLGALSGVVPRVDSATAAHMLSEPRLIASWARLLYERADLLRMSGDDAGAAAAASQAHALAREALARAEGFESVVRDLLGPLARDLA